MTRETVERLRRIVGIAEVERRIDVAQQVQRSHRQVELFACPSTAGTDPTPAVECDRSLRFARSRLHLAAALFVAIPFASRLRLSIPFRADIHAVLPLVPDIIRRRRGEALAWRRVQGLGGLGVIARSEEHTSELQSQSK